jgi:ankyrin repeat protein
VCAVRSLGKEFGIVVNQANPDGSKALFQAAFIDCLDVVQCLVKELGADINQPKSSGITPLIIAAHQGNLGVVKWLLVDGGASMYTHSSLGQTLWDALKLEDADDAKLTMLLQTMVILADAPPEFIAKFSQQQLELWSRAGSSGFSCRPT